MNGNVEIQKDANVGAVITNPRVGGDLIVIDPRRRRLSKGSRVAFGFVSALIVAGMMVGYAIVRPIETQAMQGNFNVVVASIASDADVLASEQADLGLAIFNELRDARGGLTDNDRFKFDILGPSDVPNITGASEEARSQSAAAIAEELNAHIVVYGRLEETGEGLEFQPEVFLSADTLLDDSDALTDSYGYFQFASAIPVPFEPSENATAFMDLRQDVSDIVKSLAGLFEAIDLYRTNDLIQARGRFELLLSSGDWPGESGKELVHLFIGNTYARERIVDFDSAEKSFMQAISLEPEFARAHVGLAEVQYARVSGCSFSNEDACCGNEVSNSGLLEAEDRYLSTATMQRSSTADIAEKSKYGVARIRECEYLATGSTSSLEAARVAFDSLVAAFATFDDQKKDRTSHLVAAAHSHLAVLALGPPENRTAAQYRAARIELEKGVEKAVRPVQIANMELLMSRISVLLNDCERASGHLQNAELADPSLEIRDRSRYACPTA